MTPPKRPMSEWASPAIVLTIAAMGLTAWNSYAATQTGYEVRIAKLELRVEILERGR